MSARTWVSGLMKVAAAGADGFRPSRAGVVVLGYHRVGARTGVSVDLPRALFAQQMGYLCSHFDVMPLDSALDLLSNGGPRSQRPPAVVTFDDGTADFCEEALPELVRWRVPATLYVATDHLERALPFPSGGVPASWSALQDALSTGLVTIGSHTHTHLLLDRVDGATAADELDRSIVLIGERLGVSCHHLAYPKALLGSRAAEAEVERRFRSAAIGGCRVNEYLRTNPHRLARSPIQVTDGLHWFRRKAAGGMRMEEDLRDLVNRRRYRTATN